jgi:hypothetical protein
MRFLFLMLLCAALVCSQSLNARQNNAHERLALTNDSVVAMLRAKFDDATIIKMIQQHNTNFDLSVDAMIKLKQAGASQAVLQAMIEAVPDNKKVPSAASTEVSRGTPPAASPSPAIPDLPDEIGVYVRLKDGLVAIEPEIVNWKTGGVIKHAATLGLDREHLNGTVAGPRSAVTVSTAPFGMSGGIEFIIRCPEGNSASEYELLRFWEKSDRREFRSVTGGVLHASSGAKNNVIQFQFQKVRPLTVRAGLKEHQFRRVGRQQSV